MIKLVVLTVLLFVSVFVSAEQYTSKFDNIDIDEILSSDRLLSHYVNCLMDRGNCTPDGTELKKVLSEALETGCEKCTDKQKEASKKVIRYLLKEKRTIFDELASKYDPRGTYLKRYSAELKKEGIEV